MDESVNVQDENAKVAEDASLNKSISDININDNKKDCNETGRSNPSKILLNVLKHLSQESIKDLINESNESQNEPDSSSVAVENSNETIVIKAELTSNQTESLNESRMDVDAFELQDGQITSNNEETSDSIILLLSDDENAEKGEENASKKPKLDSIVEENISGEVVTEKVEQNKNNENKSDDKENNRKFNGISKDCINPECSHGSSKFLECSISVLNFYYRPKKNKPQFVCEICFENAMKKYEILVDTFVNNKPLRDIEMHKKYEMVEVIDSDEEDEDKNEFFINSKLEQILFTTGTEIETEGIMQQICNKIDITTHLKRENDVIASRIKILEKSEKDFEKQLRHVEDKSRLWYNELYAINKPLISRRPSLDLPANTNPSIKVYQSSRNETTSNTNELHEDEIYYAICSRSEGRIGQTWAPCKLLETIEQGANGNKMYRVQFIDNPSKCEIVKGKEFALSKINNALKIGARVIAQNPRAHSKTHKDIHKRFCPGVIGEKLSKYNKSRYLVFYDYGQVNYATPQQVREIAEVSKNVWEDVHKNLSEFIQDYLQSHTQRQRALLNVHINRTVETEKNGIWRTCTIADIDCSLVKLYFPEENVYEWLYRGSKRLGPLFKQTNKNMNMNARRNTDITYVTIDDDDEDGDDENVDKTSIDSEANKRNTARKSTAPTSLLKSSSKPPSTSSNSAPTKTIILNDDQCYLYEPKTVTKYRHFTPIASIAAKQYAMHTCSNSCLVKPSHKLPSYSPLPKPLLSNWERQIVRHKNIKVVFYKAPCGRRLRNMNEVWDYLNITKCDYLNVDNFDFDTHIQVLFFYDITNIEDCPLYIPDMSEGKEGMKIPVINAFDKVPPPKLEYSAVRLPQKGVNINTDPDFMPCCDCTDDCYDKRKCSCFQMTIQGYKFANRNETMNDDDISYVWKRLLKPVQTGIYECNSRCKCSSRCLNKVVQNPIQVKMQLFRTENRGWGLECCHDIPMGTFICIYAGQLYPEDDANALCQGIDHGDEYFAELDIIETATAMKEGYESGVIYEEEESEDEEERPSSDSSDSDYDAHKDHEDEDFISRTKQSGNREIITRSARGDTNKKNSSAKKKQNVNETSDSDNEMVNMLPTASDGSGENPKWKFSLRKYFGKNEKVYIMDAKHCGNVGRYFNHSCDPNLMVQSVFVDTHDMRFPWIAFFACRAIKAGTELTWNYNYEVGSVAAKVLYCKCGSRNCRGRIL